MLVLEMLLISYSRLLVGSDWTSLIDLISKARFSNVVVEYARTRVQQEASEGSRRAWP
jgi:hypothetical protein